MSRETFERLRLPLVLGLVLMLVAGYMFIRRAEAESGDRAPQPSIVVGVSGGGVVTPAPVPSVAPTTPPTTPPPTPVLTPPPTPSPTATPTPAPRAFAGEVLACRQIDGAECIGRLDRLGRDDDSFVALVLFENAVAGDVMNAVLDGPGGAIEGGAYTLQGSGRGFYYSTFSVGGLPPGDYTLTAFRNGEPVAQTVLRKEGGRGDDDD